MSKGNVLRLFPYLKDKESCDRLMIDDDSLHFITSREYANKITDIVKLYAQKLNLQCKDVVITDATAGVGGDTLTFANTFKHIHAIEIHKLRCEYLFNNVKLYNLNNIDIINDDCANVITYIDDHNVVYIDPPWGGISYKTFDKLTLPFCNMMLEEFCNKLMDRAIMRRVPEVIVVKLPKNYNMKHFCSNVINKKIYLHDLYKMIVVVIMVVE